MDSKIEEGKKYIVRNETKTKKSGIDIVLGGQWGDEGKGKLVDILSQVNHIQYSISSSPLIFNIF